MIEMLKVFITEMPFSHGENIERLKCGEYAALQLQQANGAESINLSINQGSLKNLQGLLVAQAQHCVHHNGHHDLHRYELQ